MRIAICEDDQTHAAALHAVIARWSNHAGLFVHISVFPSAEAFLLKWTQTCPFDLVFLDTALGDMSGMELAQTIRKTDKTMSLIFVSGLRDDSIQGYEVNALRYLLKPVRAEDCIAALNLAREIHDDDTRNALVITDCYSAQSVRLPVNDIYFYASDGHYVKVHCRGESLYTFRERISTLERSLPRQLFVRCHRTVIVNVHHVNLINRRLLQMNDPEHTVLPLSDTYWGNLNKVFFALS